MSDIFKQCEQCGAAYLHWDDLAIHLVNDHHWDAERARLWLRDHVEEEAFNEPA